MALPGFEILRELEQVRLSMRVSELREVRPQIVTAPYSGARETIGSDTVWYLFDRPADREQERGRDQLEQLGGSRVVGVAITRLTASERSADSLTLDWVSRLGPPEGCFRYHYHDVATEVAVFEEPARSVYVTKRPPSGVTLSGRTVQLASGVQLLIASPDSRAVPVAPRVEPVDCSLLFASAVQRSASSGGCLGAGVLTPTRAGALQLGMAKDSVSLLCPVVEEVDMTAPATATLLIVDLGSDSLRVWTHNDRVGWIDVGSSALRTSGGIGVGVPLGRLLDVEGIEGRFGDGFDVFVLYVAAGPLCGLSFRIDAETALALAQVTRSRMNPAETQAALSRFRETGRVTAVWVIGRAAARCLD